MAGGTLVAECVALHPRLSPLDADLTEPFSDPEACGPQPSIIRSVLAAIHSVFVGARRVHVGQLVGVHDAS